VHDSFSVANPMNTESYISTLCFSFVAESKAATTEQNKGKVTGTNLWLPSLIRLTVTASKSAELVLVSADQSGGA